MSRNRWMCLGLAALAVLYLRAAPVAHSYAPKGRSGSGPADGGGAEPDVAFLTPGESGSDAGSQSDAGSSLTVSPTSGRTTTRATSGLTAVPRNGQGDGRSVQAPLDRRTLMAAWLQSRLGWVVYLMTLPR